MTVARKGTEHGLRYAVCQKGRHSSSFSILADYLWNYPRVMCIFWFVFALTIAGIKVCRRETEAA